MIDRLIAFDHSIGLGIWEAVGPSKNRFNLKNGFSRKFHDSAAKA